MKNLLYFLLGFICLACGGRTGDKKNYSEDSRLQTCSLTYARNLTIQRLDSSDIYFVTVRNPWDSVKTLQKYLLLPKNTEAPSGFEDAVKVRVPLERSLVYSSLHSGLIYDLGASGSIAGVCNGRYVTDSLLKRRIESGEVPDCGDGMNPDLEKIISLHPDGILLSPFENNDRYSKVADLGIPVIECADYMEKSALAQAEWMKFYGLLFGKGVEAEERFNRIAERYNRLKASAANNGKRPKIVMDLIYGQSWSQPGGESTIGKIITDAGGNNPFSKYLKSGGVELSPEQVLATAGDADIWLVRYNQKTDKTLSELGKDAPVYSRIKAYGEGKVYGCNTEYIPFFDRTPFHPDILLEEFIKIFKGETDSLRYFKIMNN